MILDLNKIKNNLTRMIADPSFAFRVYGIWAFMVVVFFGVLGVYPLYKVVIQKYQTMTDMKNVNLSLEKKINFLTTEQAAAEKYKSKIELLDNYLPDEINAQDYLVDLSLITSKAGFGLVGLNPAIGDQPSREHALLATLKGSGYIGLIDLVNNIESMGRTTQIDKLTYVFDRSIGKIDLDLTIYTLGAK